MKRLQDTPIKMIPLLYNLSGNIWLTPIECQLLQSNLIAFNKEISFWPQGILTDLKIDQPLLLLEISRLNSHIKNRTYPRIKSSDTSTKMECAESAAFWDKIAICGSCLTIGGCICETNTYFNTPLDPKSRKFQEKHEPPSSFSARDFRFGNNLIKKLTRRLNSDRIVLKVKGSTSPSADSILPHEILRDKYISYQDVVAHRTISLPQDRSNIWPENSQLLEQFDSNLLIPRAWENDEQVMELCKQITELHGLPVQIGPNGLLSDIGLKIIQNLSQYDSLIIPL